MRKEKILLTSSVIFLFCLMIISVYIGGYGDIPIKKILKIIFLMDNSDSTLYSIFWSLRIPRICMALLVGMLLGSSGAVTQTLFKNPMADPYIVGISASGMFGAMVAYLLGISEWYYGIFASIFSFFISLLIFKISVGKGRSLNLTSLLVVGVAISALLRALTSLAISLIGEDSYRIILWSMGSLEQGSWLKIFLLLIPLIASLLFFYWNRYNMDIILLSDEEARSLGIDTRKFKYKVLIVATLMVGFSVAFSGMIGFVGLIIPHIVRMIFGMSNIKVIPISMFWGGIFLLLCDTIARGVVSGSEIPIGVVTAIFGAPFFIYLAMKRRKL